MTAADALVAYKGNQVCRVCITEARVRWRLNRRRKGKLVNSCQRCGREKYRDDRLMCFACKDATRGERARTPAQVDSALIDAILLEVAPQWVKLDPLEHAPYIAFMRLRGLNP